jgi:hypothetical protein
MKIKLLVKKLYLLCFLLLLLAIKVKAQTPLYSSVLVSDQGTNNSLGQANTSRNLAIDAEGILG